MRPPRPAATPPKGQRAAPDYGFYAPSGALFLPFFGLTPAGIPIGLGRNPETNAHADLHQECPAQNPDCGLDPATSFIWARRKMAADNIDIPFRVDYFRADRTADPKDGWNDLDNGKDDIDRPGKSRGTLFAFAAEEGLDP